MVRDPGLRVCVLNRERRLERVECLVGASRPLEQRAFRAEGANEVRIAVVRKPVDGFGEHRERVVVVAELFVDLGEDDEVTTSVETWGVPERRADLQQDLERVVAPSELGERSRSLEVEDRSFERLRNTVDRRRCAFEQSQRGRRVPTFDLDVGEQLLGERDRALVFSNAEGLERPFGELRSEVVTAFERVQARL